MEIRGGQAQIFGVNLFTNFGPATAEKLSQTPSTLLPRTKNVEERPQLPSRNEKPRNNRGIVQTQTSPT